jgi:GLPGLI family protein
MMRFLLPLLLLAPLAAGAQHGTVVYEETVRIEVELPPEMEHMRGQIPRETSSRNQLLFDGQRSLMRALPEERQQLEAETGRRGMMRMRQMRMDSETFTDREAGRQVESRNFLERTFLISSEPLNLPWRLTNERAEFLGYMAQKAVATTEDGAAVEAWFTPQIPVSAGPGRYGGLPGLILVLTVDDGRRSFVAREVSLDPLAEAIETPSRGREVTREEFDAIVEERMGDLGGRRGTVQFRIQN